MLRKDDENSLMINDHDETNKFLYSNFPRQQFLQVRWRLKDKDMCDFSYKYFLVQILPNLWSLTLKHLK